MMKRGFTLIEVLITVAILAVVSTILFQTMSVSFDAKRRVTEINDRYHEGRQVMVRMTRELRMAFLRFEVPEQFRQEDPSVITRFQGEQDQIHFPTTAHLRLRAENRESDQAEIAYFLKTSDRRSAFEGKTLFRRESSRIDDRHDKGGTIWPVIDGVREFKLEYWDEANAIGGDAWQNTWDTDSDEQNLLPSRIRITLVLDNGDRPDIRFVAQAAPQLRRPVSVIDIHAGGNRAAQAIRDQIQDNENTPP